MLEVLQELRAELVEKVRTAWAFGPTDPVELGWPRNAAPTYPQAAIVTDSVEREFAGPRVVEEVYSLTIEGRFPIPEDGTLDDLKLDRARELCEALCPTASEVAGSMASPAAFVTGVYLPHVSSVEFGQDEDSDAYYSVRAVFQARASVFQ